MKKHNVGTGRLGSYRSGDRSEYLAIYALSRVAFVNAAPRQEDFGVVDFACVLARNDGKYVLPENAFYVQVKSNKRRLILKGVALNWLSQQMQHPLFICVVDKNRSEISVYSCMALWQVVVGTRGVPTSITIKFDGNSSGYTPHDNTLDYTVYLGPPVLTQSLAQIEADATTAYSVLKSWIELEGGNVAYRNVGRVAYRQVEQWTTNVALPTDVNIRMVYGGNMEHRAAERDVAPILMALKYNYGHARQWNKGDYLVKYLSLILEHLDDHSRQLVQAEVANRPELFAGDLEYP